MHMTKVSCLLLVLLCCELCSSIKVPVTWDESASSEVKNEPIKESVEIIVPQNVPAKKPSYYKPVPVEYFEYTAQKPKFAADIAAFHGVQNPQDHYKAYPVQPFTGQQKPVLGVHQILNEKNTVFQPFQNYVQQNGPLQSVKPIASNYEVFHPYQAEEPALEAIYKDPVLAKIRSDLQDSKTRLQNYEKEAGEPNITKDEYLESPEKTDSKIFPHQNVPAKYEIHRPQRKPVYYVRPHQDPNRHNALNQRFKHPWNQYAKIRPAHYRPLHNHIKNLRQQHAMKYDDERNEYPQVQTSSNVAEPQEGYDIYEKGKDKYEQLRNNLDESVNKIAQQNRPPNYQKLELQKQEPANESDDEEDEFIPVKNYAQVRKTETYKHLPKKAAFDDAETYEEILNAPRLREAVKSTKAQTVYSEEGYEDSAYDHAGEQKHASDHEGHGGFLKEHQNSGGLFKIPTFSGKYSDGRGVEYRDNLEHGEKWKNNNKDEEEEIEAESFSEDEHEENIEANLHKDEDPEIANRNKRQDSSNSDAEDSENKGEEDSEYDDDNNENVGNDNSTNKQENITLEHGVGKREANFEVPEINITSTLSIPNNDTKTEKLLAEPKTDSIKEKYPYYFNPVKGINKNSPLRYAEDLKLIPLKSNGGTEFYDSRSQLECSEVDEDVDPIPEKLKKGENPEEDDDENSNAKKSFETVKKQPRLRGLGDKIDCFKAKYFGENPLDSPFFKEDVIPNPEPISAPKLSSFKIKGDVSQTAKLSDVFDLRDKLKEAQNTNVFVIVDKLKNDQKNLQESLNKTKENLITNLYTPINNTQQNLVYDDILKNIKSTAALPLETLAKSLLSNNTDSTNTTYNFFKNKEAVTLHPIKLRKKRATPFVYEPYKIIRDSQVQDSKKTTTTSNISPLIKQLQSSRVAERVSRSNIEDKQPKRSYVDIGRKERIKPSKNDNESNEATFVDVSVDHRRGEPRYEIRPANHKSEYTPVENKRAMTVDAYNSHTTTEKNNKDTQKVNRGRQRFRVAQTSAKPYYDVSQFIPKSTDIQNAASSNNIKKTSAAPIEISKSREDYEDDDQVDEVKSITTTTTVKPSFRRRMKVERTAQISTTEEEPEHATDLPRLRLVTRFRNYKPAEEKTEVTEPSTTQTPDKDDETIVPKYREKKKKSHTSTIVTDIKKYGDDDEDNLKKEEVDALIGVKADMNDYMPMYEKEEEDKMAHHRSKKNGKPGSDKGNDNNYKHESDDDKVVDGDDDDDDDDDDYDIYDDDDDFSDENENENEDEDDDDSDEEDDIEAIPAKTPEKLPQMPEVATTHPIKHTLVKTTPAPPTTVPTRVRTTTTPAAPIRNIRIVHKPVVTRKKIEIHKESPANKSSPHMTQFKQDIEEVEIIKEIPAVHKKKQQNKAATPTLELYKDDGLAKAINDLSDVELFSDSLDLANGPKHGGNYRKATKEDLRLLKSPADDTGTNHPTDAETSQSKRLKNVEFDEYVPTRLHGGNLKAMSDIEVTSERSRSAKLIELSEPPKQSMQMHGGNLRYDKRRNGSRRNQKLVEFGYDSGEDRSSRKDDEDDTQASRSEKMHGGNYKSAKLVSSADDDIQVKSSKNNARINSAVLLNSYAQAVPILTTTPGYIVDPSKRMYYYVDA